MRRSSCPEHGPLALELARGELEFPEAVAAEDTVAGCPACAAILAGLEHPEVTEGVTEGLFLARRRYRRRRRLRVMAAAAAVLLAAGLLTLVPHSRRPGKAAASELVHRVFEQRGSAGADLNGDGRVDAADLAVALQHGRSATPTS